MPHRPSKAICAALALLAPLALAAPLHAEEATQASGVSFGGYADVLYAHYDFGPDQKSGANGSPPDSRAIFDLQRFVFELGYDFDDRTAFEAEIEFEHGGTGAALELEYEEFGEYEIEVEKGGEIVLEQIHLTHHFSKALALRAGHFIIGVGSVNDAHLPSSHFGTVRPEAETSMIPVTWHETGLEVFGRLSHFAYRVQIVNGLDSSGFSSKFWVRDGHQKRFEQVRATDLAVVGRLTWSGMRGLSVSASGYTGDTSGNRPKSDMQDIPARLTILGSDLHYERGALRARASILFGHLQNAGEVSRKNSRLSTNLGVARTPVAQEALSWGAEAGVDVLPMLRPNTRMALLPFVRVEQVNTMVTVEDGFFADPRFDRTITTAGLNWFPKPTIVVKGDVSIRSLGAPRYRDEQTWGLSMGLIF